MKVVTAITLCALAGTAFAAIPFGSAVSISSPQRPSGLAIGDLNGDGATDMAVTTDTPNKISIYFGNNTGTFGAPVNVPTGAGTSPDSIVAADIEGDGDLDLVVVLKNISTTRVFVNNGTGVFVAGSSAATGANPRGLIAADLDGDSDADFAVANPDSDTLTVFLNSGGVLVASTLATGQDPRAVAAGDLDGDGDRELIVTNHDDATLSTFTNGGNASFTTGPTILVCCSLRPAGLTTGDMDGDGDVDILATTDDADRGLNFVSVWQNNGGMFAAQTNFGSGGAGPDSVIVSDLDLDGDLDALVINQDSNTVGILEGTGTGAFLAATPVTVGARPGAIATGDLDASGTPDVVVTNQDSNSVSLLLNQLQAPDCVSDFDNDGDADSDDVIAFFAAWDSGNPTGDVDGDLDADSDDIVTFFASWEAGC